MAFSIRRRLLHPRTALRQGLATGAGNATERGEATRGIDERARREMEDYLKAVPLHHETTATLAQQEHLYTCLNIIDGKAQALLSFNSFLLAIVGIYFGTIDAVREQPLILVPFLATIVTSGLSCLLCLDVVWVHWLTKNDMLPVPGQDASVIGEGFLELLILRDERTRNYRMAWFLSFFSVVAVLVGVVLALTADWLLLAW